MRPVVTSTAAIVPAGLIALVAVNVEKDSAVLAALAAAFAPRLLAALGLPAAATLARKTSFRIGTFTRKSAFLTKESSIF